MDSNFNLYNQNKLDSISDSEPFVADTSIEVTEVRTRLAIVSVIVGKLSPVDKLNSLLHQYSEYIIGRMGLPQKSRGISLISIALDAPNDAINALSGKIGRLVDTKVKVLYA